MAKKMFLMPEEFFYEQDPFMIACLIGTDYAAVALHCPGDESGGLVNFPLFPGEQEQDGLLEETVTFSRLAFAIQQLNERSIAINGLVATVVAAESDETRMQAGEFTYNLDLLVRSLEQYGLSRVNREIVKSPGAKIYFKNWDNSLRVLEVAAPAFLKPMRPRGEGPIEVVIVDDSNLVQSILTRTIGQDPEFHIAASASDAFAGTEKILEHNPDVVILDVIMPQINGLKYLGTLMHFCPKPVIIFSTMGKTGGQIEKQAFETGAVDVVDKKSLNLSDPRSIDVIKEKIRAASKYVVVKKE